MAAKRGCVNDLLTRLAALTTNGKLREAILTAIKSAPAVRHVEGRHQNALGHIIAEKIGYQVTPESQADAVFTVVGAREAAVIALVREAAGENADLAASLKDVLSRFRSCIAQGNGEIEGDKEAIARAEGLLRTSA